jgi:hypothetical protein
MIWKIFIIKMKKHFTSFPDTDTLSFLFGEGTTHIININHIIDFVCRFDSFS